MRTNIGARAIVVKEGKVLLIHRRNEGREYWVFPGGGVEDDETPEKTVAREVKEETGAVISCGEKFAEQDSNGGKQLFFRCEIVSGEGELKMTGPEKQTENDWYQPEWRDLSEIRNLTLHPIEVRDMLLVEEFGKKK